MRANVVRTTQTLTKIRPAIIDEPRCESMDCFDVVFPLDLRSFGAHGTEYRGTMLFRLPTRGFTKQCKRYSIYVLTKRLYPYLGMLTVKYGADCRSGNGSAYSPRGCLSRKYCSSFPKRRRNWTERSMDFIKYSREDLYKLDRRSLQLICKSIGMNASLKVSIIPIRCAAILLPHTC